MRAKNSAWVYDSEYLRRVGAPPLEVLEATRQVLERYLSEGFALVGQNLTGFDVPLLRQVFQDFLGRDWELPPNTCFDVGAAYKAWRGSIMPGDQDARCWEKYFSRVARTKSPAGESYHLERVCALLGVPCENPQWHQAHYDAAQAARAMEALRGRLRA
jgi:DNA polymerase III epsilon subunit-like protein